MHFVSKQGHQEIVDPETLLRRSLRSVRGEILEPGAGKNNGQGLSREDDNNSRRRQNGLPGKEREEEDGQSLRKAK